MHILMDARQDRRDTYADLWAPLRPLLAAEAAAQAPPGGGIEAADLEQAVWLRLLELNTPPAEPGRWLSRAVGAELRDAARRIRSELPYDDPGGPAARHACGVEEAVLAAEQRRNLLATVRGLPGRCPQVVSALMSRSDPTYQEISRELGISQGSLGPLRSRCLGCLRTILKSRVGSPVGRGNAR
jgi:DNA-directed RNA polymerase specialized sigma24 family protein